MVDKLSSSCNEIIKIIESLSRKNAWLKVTKSYRGLILRDAVKIIAVEQNRAVFQAFDKKICIACEKFAYLHNPAFQKPVRARIKDTCINEGMFTLADFTYQGTTWQDRRHERVQPRQPTYGLLTTKASQYRLPLKNISLNGMGLLVHKSVNQDRGIKLDSIVELDFQISPEFRWSSLKGKIVYLIKASKSLLRLGINLQPSSQQSKKLEDYISLRKEEIMHELDQAYFASNSPMGIEYQFF